MAVEMPGAAGHQDSFAGHGHHDMGSVDSWHGWKVRPGRYPKVHELAMRRLREETDATGTLPW